MSTKKAEKLIPFICKYCGAEYGIGKYWSQRNKDYCTIQCSNKARTLPLRECANCGKSFRPRVRYGEESQLCCSQRCGNQFKSKKSTMNRLVVKDLYGIVSEDRIAEITGYSLDRIHRIMRRHKRNNGIGKKAQYENLSRRMKTNNPMKRPEVIQRVKDYWTTHPEQALIKRTRFMEGYSKLQRNKPTKLEYKLCAILDQLGIEYEHQYVVKDKFIVDVKIGNVIIEADGDWWHGHARFEPLNDRQLKQQSRDNARNKYLTKCGYIVIRIWESDMSFETVVNKLKQHGVLD